METTPRVIAIAAQSIDGRIARDDQETTTKWTSPEDTAFFVQETTRAGVVVMGRTTFETFNKPLRRRLNVVLTRQPEKQHSQPNILEFTDQSPTAIIGNLRERNFHDIFVIGGTQTYSSFLESKLLDEIWLSVEPVFFEKGSSIFQVGTYNVSSKLLFAGPIKPGSNTALLKYSLSYD